MAQTQQPHRSDWTDVWYSVAAVAGSAGRSTWRTLRAWAGLVDPDVRHQLAELPLFALTQLYPSGTSAVLRQEPAAPDAPAYTEPVPRPVVLIHGLGGSAGNFVVMRALMHLQPSARPVYQFDYRAFRDMSEVVPAFRAWLVDVHARHPGVRMDVIAHSMGGLIVRAALLEASVASMIDHVLTIGTPHHGSHLARWGGASWTVDIRPDSPFMTSIADVTPANRGDALPRFTAFWTRRDVIVIPAESACLEGATNVAMHQATHVSWLIRPRQILAILQHLGPPSAEPSPNAPAGTSTGTNSQPTLTATA